MDDFERFSLQQLQVFALLASRSASRLRRLDREFPSDAFVITEERAHLHECLDRIEEIRAVGDGLDVFAAALGIPLADDTTLDLEGRLRSAVRMPRPADAATRTGRRFDA